MRISRSLSSICAALILLTAAASVVKAEKTPADLVKATLVADAASIAPGGTFTLGVRLIIKPHWHTYWVNPGEFGNATRIRPTGPAGFEFGEVQWPLPSKIDKDGSITFGYENEVLLMIPVKITKNVDTSGATTIHADVTWLACQEACIEGGAKLEINLQLSEKASPANAELFAAWKGRLPIAPTAASDAIANVSQAAAADGALQPVVTVNWKVTPKSIEWFPISTRAVLVDDIAVKTEGTISQIRFKATVYKPQDIPGGKIDSVLVYEDASGKRVGVTVPVSVAKPK